MEYLESFSGQIKDYNSLLDFNKILFMKEFYIKIIYREKPSWNKGFNAFFIPFINDICSIKKYHTFLKKMKTVNNKKELDELFVN